MPEWVKPLWRVGRWYALAAMIVLLDQWTKAWMSAELVYGRPWVITDFFNFTLLHNPGAAFSFLSDAGGWQRWLFTALAAGVSLVLVVWLARLRGQLLLAWGLTLILGGAIGNGYDRIMLGYVVDFIVLHYQQYAWPAFNVADSAITVGVGLVLLDSWRQGRQEKSKQEKGKQQERRQEQDPSTAKPVNQADAKDAK